MHLHAIYRHTVYSLAPIPWDIYFTLIYPYITYCNIVWGSNYSSRLQNLHNVQKIIIRLITNSNFRESTKPLYRKLKILDLHEVNAFLTGLFTYSQRTNLLPNTFSDYFILNKHIRHHNTRSAMKLHINFHRTNYRKFSLKAKGAKLWNSLPDEVIESKSYATFKRKLKLTLLNLYN